MSIRQETVRYERWMSAHFDPVKPDLIYKHAQMAESPFAFLRATFYRWIRLWDYLCRHVTNAPAVLAVGDLHLENYGTWRDEDGRLIWGINDFDEAYRLPYTMDLVRLATSALLAIKSEHLSLGRRQACECILEGYSEGIHSGGKPFVLGEEHTFLRDIALSKLRDPVHFWARMRAMPDFRTKASKELAIALRALLPEENISYRIKRRRAGLGSLGRPRFVALADWRGGPIAREAKQALPSAYTWVEGRSQAAHVWYSEIIRKAVRVPDPFVKLVGNWIVRRLAPDCSRIELWSLPKKRDEALLLRAMGFETANIHLGSRGAVSQIRRDLHSRPAGWLADTARVMLRAVEDDWQHWRHS